MPHRFYESINALNHWIASMFQPIIQSYEAFEKSGMDDPLVETVHLLNILTNGAVQKADTPLKTSIDLPYIVQKRKAGVPLEYILEQATFMGLAFHSTPAAFVPRQETELLVQTTLDFIVDKQAVVSQPLIADMGTGSGIIAISLATFTENSQILASDISPEARALAQKNVDRFELQDRVTLFCGDLFTPLQAAGYHESIDVVVCNPPYIPTHSLSTLAPGIIDHEPTLALDAGAYGLTFYRRLITETISMLKPKGVLVFEIGVGQEALVTRLLQNKGYENPACFKNGEGHIRVVSAVKATSDRVT